LLALRNAAKFWQNGKIVDVAGPDLMATAQPYHIYPGFAFVAYPNRDSTPYKERYNIPEAETIIRGTLRYVGFPLFVKVLVDIGFLNDEERSFLKEPISWKDATRQIIGASNSSEQDLISTISTKGTFGSEEEESRILAGFRWLGIFSDAKITPKGNALDTLCATLEEKMQFEEGERDLVILQHKFVIENKDGSTETRTSTLCEYGAPTGSGGYSAMAKLVGMETQAAHESENVLTSLGVPCAVAVQQVLNGTISEKGILAPMLSKINDPLKKELKEKYGLVLPENF
jgi:saccharopine dehydrogenase (NADP+, L-glutamate forming)